MSDLSTIEHCEFIVAAEGAIQISCGRCNIHFFIGKRFVYLNDIYASINSPNSWHIANAVISILNHHDHFQDFPEGIFRRAVDAIHEHKGPARSK